MVRSAIRRAGPHAPADFQQRAHRQPSLEHTGDCRADASPRAGKAPHPPPGPVSAVAGQLDGVQCHVESVPDRHAATVWVVQHDLHRAAAAGTLLLGLDAQRVYDSAAKPTDRILGAGGCVVSVNNLPPLPPSRALTCDGPQVRGQPVRVVPAAV